MENHHNKIFNLHQTRFPKISSNFGTLESRKLKHQNQILHITRKTDFSSSLLEWTSLLKTKKLFYGVGKIHHRLPKNCSMELEKFITDFQKIVLWSWRNSSQTSKNCSMELEKFITDFQKNCSMELEKFITDFQKLFYGIGEIHHGLPKIPSLMYWGYSDLWYSKLYYKTTLLL